MIGYNYVNKREWPGGASTPPTVAVSEWITNMRTYRTPSDITPQQAELFWSKVDKTGNCWIWTASGCGRYGKVCIAGVTYAAHRVAYVLSGGVLPDYLPLDHVRERGCTSTMCVNPAHLEPVTQRENLIRSDNIVGINARKTHCKRGHELSGQNVFMSNETRQCRECHRMRLERRRRSRGVPDRSIPITHCKRGHEYTPENTRSHSTGKRSCLMCAHLQAKDRWQKKKAAKVVNG